MKKILYNLDDYIAVIALSGIIMVTSLGVLMRFVIGSPLTWVEEVDLALFVWLTFIGVSTVMKQDGHVSIDYVVNKFPRPVIKFFYVFRNIILYIIFIWVFIILGFQLTIQSLNQLTPVLSIKHAYIDLAVPLGGIMSIIYLTLYLVKTRSKGKGDQ